MTDNTVHLQVDEIGIALHAPVETRQWWELYRRRHAGRLTTIAVRVPGDLVEIDCEDRAHAEWLRAELRGRGVPQRSLVIKQQPKPAAAPAQ